MFGSVSIYCKSLDELKSKIDLLIGMEGCKIDSDVAKLEIIKSIQLDTKKIEEEHFIEPEFSDIAY